MVAAHKRVVDKKLLVSGLWGSRKILVSCLASQPGNIFSYILDLIESQLMGSIHWTNKDGDFKLKFIRICATPHLQLGGDDAAAFALFGSSMYVCITAKGLIRIRK